MLDLRHRTRGLPTILAVVVLVHFSPCRASAATVSSDIYSNLVSQYLHGDWDDLTASMKSHAKEIAALSAAQKADVDYTRRTIMECRPAWWAEAKAGKLDRFRPVVWGKSIAAIYDPTAKTTLSITYLNGTPLVTIKWNAEDMDSPTIKGELEFTQSEHADLDIWRGLGTAQSWGLIPPRQQLGLSEAQQKQLTRYLSFRGNVAGAYYAMPRARRLALWEGISGWSHEYDHAGMYMPMRAIGILLVAEVLGHPETYPSIPWPEEPPADGAESKMIWELQKWIRYHDLPLSEDRALRDAFKAFAAANEGHTRQTALAVLPNKLTLSLDPEADPPLSVLRDKWIKDRYAAKHQ
jgi:hypothetical protein